MFVLRLVILFLVLAAGLSALAYLFTRNRRYLEFAGRIIKFTFVFLIVLGGFFVIERFVLR